MSDPERNKAIVRRAVDEVLNEGRMEVIELIAEGDKVVARFKCSGTHRGEWRGRPPTGRRFEDVDEVYIFTLEGGRIVHAWGLEDTLTRMRQLDLAPD